MFCGEISYPWPPFLLGGGGRDRQGVVLSGYLPEMLFCRLRCLRARGERREEDRYGESQRGGTVWDGHKLCVSVCARETFWMCAKHNEGVNALISDFQQQLAFIQDTLCFSFKLQSTKTTCSYSSKQQLIYGDPKEFEVHWSQIFGVETILILKFHT